MRCLEKATLFKINIINKLFFLVTISFSLCFDIAPDSYHEIDFGRNYPTALYDKYTDDGFSVRYSFSRAFKRNNTLREGLFKWQVGVQYIHFRSDHWIDEITLDNTENGPNVDITNYEQGFVFNGGFRLTASNGLSKKGNFRPYIGGLIGMSVFSEKTSYDFGDGCSTLGWFMDILLDADWCDNNNNSTDVEDRSSSPTFTLDLGFNVFFDQVQDVGLDFGVRYNMLTHLKRPDQELLYYSDGDENFIQQISNNIEADYYTLYIGIVWRVGSANFKNKNKKKGGRLI